MTFQHKNKQNIDNNNNKFKENLNYEDSKIIISFQVKKISHLKFIKNFRTN